MIIAYLFCSYEKAVSFDMELILGIDMTNTKPRKLLMTKNERKPIAKKKREVSRNKVKLMLSSFS